jgi:hypothetical protein
MSRLKQHTSCRKWWKLQMKFGRGAVCAQFRMQDGTQISLENAPKQVFQTGTRFRLKGDWVRVSRCMQGKAFAVDGHVRL